MGAAAAAAAADGRWSRKYSINESGVENPEASMAVLVADEKRHRDSLAIAAVAAAVVDDDDAEKNATHDGLAGRTTVARHLTG